MSDASHAGIAVASPRVAAVASNPIVTSPARAAAPEKSAADGCPSGAVGDLGLDELRLAAAKRGRVLDRVCDQCTDRLPAGHALAV